MPRFAIYEPPEIRDLESLLTNDTPMVKTVERSFKSLPCPQCRTLTPRKSLAQRRIFDYGDEEQRRPVQLHVQYSRHQCPQCRKYFNADTSDLAPPKSTYTHRVIRHAIRLVVEDNQPYRTASWNLWRDHVVFVPFATIQNWVEAAGKKRRRSRQTPRVP